jgi:hypothetical protein
LVEEEHVITAAFVSVEIEILKGPTDSSISCVANQRLEDGILSGNKPVGCAQHLCAQKATAEKSTLSDLPRSP